jgi:hypothetical protein
MGDNALGPIGRTLTAAVVALVAVSVVGLAVLTVV